METNFKVDVPSFALGYSAGKKKGGSGGGVELNIAYGDTPPEDTTKMWCKTSQADGVDILPVDRIDSLKPISKIFAGGEAVVVDNKIYIVCPYTSGSANIGENKIYCYDTETKELLPDTLTTRDRKDQAAWHYNGKLYSFGGYTTNRMYGNEATITKLSDKTRTSLSTSFDGYTSGMGIGIINEKVYFFGGGKDGSFVSPTTRIAYFDCETDTIVPVDAVLPSARACVGTVVYGDKIYIIGGTINYRAQKTIYCFDTITNEIKAEAYLPQPIWSPVCALFGDDVYIMYGKNQQGSSETPTYNQNVYVYNITNNTVKEFPMKLDAMLTNPIHASVDMFYLIGGSFADSTYGTPTDQVNTIRPVPIARPNCLTIETADSGVPFTIFSGQNNVKSSVHGVYKGDAEGTAEPVETAIYNGNEWETI